MVIKTSKSAISFKNIITEKGLQSIAKKVGNDENFVDTAQRDFMNNFVSNISLCIKVFENLSLRLNNFKTEYEQKTGISKKKMSSYRQTFKEAVRAVFILRAIFTGTPIKLSVGGIAGNNNLQKKDYDMIEFLQKLGASMGLTENAKHMVTLSQTLFNFSSSDEVTPTSGQGILSQWADLIKYGTDSDRYLSSYTKIFAYDGMRKQKKRLKDGHEEVYEVSYKHYGYRKNNKDTDVYISYLQQGGALHTQYYYGAYGQNSYTKNWLFQWVHSIYLQNNNAIFTFTKAHPLADLFNGNLGIAAKPDSTPVGRGGDSSGMVQYSGTNETTYQKFSEYQDKFSVAKDKTQKLMTLSTLLSMIDGNATNGLSNGDNNGNVYSGILPTLRALQKSIVKKDGKVYGWTYFKSKFNNVIKNFICDDNAGEINTSASAFAKDVYAELLKTFPSSSN